MRDANRLSDPGGSPRAVGCGSIQGMRAPTGLGLAIAACWLAWAAPAAAGAGPASLRGRVVGVTDGDTLTVLVDERPLKVRLAQIDAPESGQPWGRRAKRALSDLTFAQDARVDVGRWTATGELSATCTWTACT